MKTPPSHFKSLLIVIILIISSFNPSQSYYVSGDTIYDLVETDSTSFATEVASWTASGLKTSGVKVSTCWDEYILGGYNILSSSTGYFYKQYTGLSSHNVVYVSIRIFQIDSWDYSDGDHFNLGFDSTTLVCWTFQRSSTYWTYECGNSAYAELKPMTTKVTLPHTSSTLTVYVYSKFDEASSNESVGFRDITITIATVDDPPTSASFCGVSQDFPLSSNICQCDDDQIMSPANTGNCIDCDSSCATCSGTTTTCTSCDDGKYLSGSSCLDCDDNCATCSGTSTTCTSCESGWYMVGTTCYSTCTSPLYSSVSNGVTYCNTPCANQYVLWDGTCSSTCSYSNDCGSYAIVGSTESTFLRCDYPCSTSQYLYWNTSCLSSCPSPLTGVAYKSRNFCGYCCSDTQYLYWNGSCLSSCPSPLTGELQGTYLQRYFCWYTCQPDEYLYWNGSCLSTCPSPLSGELEGTYLQRYFCWYTCQPSEYLYWNGTCSSTCPSPLTGETQGTYLERNFCWYTCQPDEYLYWNYTCSSTCPYPLSGETQGTYLPRKFCWYICMPWQWVYWDQTCQEDCESPLWPETQGTYLERQFCWYPCTSESKFLYWNGTCLTECPEPLSTRYQNGQWFCDYPCLTTEYLYWNGSCLSACDSPLSARSEGSPTRNFCYYLCDTDEFLYWDGSCQSSCDSPLTAVAEGDPTRQFCWYLCNTDEYLYWNGTCSSECESPLTKTVVNNRNYCEYPCLPNQHLFWNGSCLSSCPYSLSTRVEGDTIKTNFCDFPCETTEYLYWNGSCLDTCNSPLSTRIEGSTISRKFCDYPCVGKQFLYWNGSCKTRCQLPLVIRIEADRGYCDYLCAASEIIYWDGSCGSSCSSPLISKSYGTPTRNYCIFPCQTGQFLYEGGTCSDSCKSPLTSSILNSQLFCYYSCTTGQYLYWNGSCLDSCSLPYSNRTENSLQYCDFPCTDSQYLYWNGSCIDSCDSPFLASTTDDKLYCDFPCDSTSEYLYWNGTCSSTCSSPFTLISNICTSACKTDQYLYYNGTCSRTCNSPLSASTDTNVLLCEYPCSSSEYLAWNSSCLTSCPSPLITTTISGKNFCDKPCKYDSEYAYWNGTCSSLCNFPLQTRNESSMLYCDYPCDPSEYLFFTGSCVSSCSLPYTITVEGETILRNFCGQNCTSDEYLYWNGSCREKCESPRRITINNSINYCEKPCEEPNIYYYETLKSCEATCDSSYKDIDYLVCTSSSDSSTSLSNFEMFLHAPLEENALTFVSLVKTMQYVRYMDIDMPSRLQRLAESKGRPLLSVKSGIKMWGSLKEHFTKHTLSDVYSNLDLYSSFLVNYWEDLMTIFFGLVLALIFSSCEKLSRAYGKEKEEVIFRTLRVLTKWNFVLMFVAFNIDDLILYSALQFRNFDTSSFADTISSLFSILAVLFIPGFLLASSYLILTYLPRNKNNPNLENYQIFFKSFHQNPHSSLLVELFFVFYTLRIAFPMILAVCLEKIPIFNIFLQLIFNIGVLIYIIKTKPFAKKINYIQLVLFETLTLLMNFSMLFVTFLSHFKMQNHMFAILLGDFIILGNDFINILGLIFMVIKLHLEIKEIQNLTKEKIVQGNKIIGLWIQLLFIPLQQVNMGFEEILAYPAAHLPLPPRKSRTRRTYEETEISLKDNYTFTEGVISETQKTAPGQFYLIETSFGQTDSPNKSSPERDLSKYLDTSSSPTKNLLNISPEVFDNFQIDILTFDKNSTTTATANSKSSKQVIFKGVKNDENNEFVVSRTVSTEMTSKQEQKKIPTEETETLDLENDDALIGKIRKNLKTLNKQIDKQEDQKSEKKTHDYLKKNASLKRPKSKHS